MVQLLTDEEKYLEMLQRHHISFGKMNLDELKDYVELMALFLKTNDRIKQEGAVDTMCLLFHNIINK